MRDAEIDDDARLVVQCEGPEDSADLSRPDTLRVVLRRMRDAPGVTGVILVHDREKSYGSHAMAVLRTLLALERLLEQLAQRAPAPHFPGFAAKEVAAVCARCPFRPATMFRALQERVLGDPRAFSAALANLASSLTAHDEDGCRACVRATLQDLSILVQEMERPPGDP